MSKKWMVFDTASRDMIFHETEEKALKDFDDAVSMIEHGDESEHKVYLFKIEKEVEIILGEND